MAAPFISPGLIRSPISLPQLRLPFLVLYSVATTSEGMSKNNLTEAEIAVII